MTYDKLGKFRAGKSTGIVTSQTAEKWFRVNVPRSVKLGDNGS